MAAGLDRDWFFGQLKARGQSLRKLAKHMKLDPSAVSRIVNGERDLKATEQDAIAGFLGISVQEVAAHRLTEIKMPQQTRRGFEEMQQSPLASTAAKKPPASKTGPAQRHPAFGIWKGKVRLLADYDYTQPADPEWGKVYED